MANGIPKLEDVKSTGGIKSYPKTIVRSNVMDTLHTMIRHFTKVFPTNMVIDGTRVIIVHHDGNIPMQNRMMSVRMFNGLLVVVTRENEYVSSDNFSDFERRMMRDIVTKTHKDGGPLDNMEGRHNKTSKQIIGALIKCWIKNPTELHKRENRIYEYVKYSEDRMVFKTTDLSEAIIFPQICIKDDNDTRTVEQVHIETPLRKYNTAAEVLKLMFFANKRNKILIEALIDDWSINKFNLHGANGGGGYNYPMADVDVDEGYNGKYRSGTSRKPSPFRK